MALQVIDETATTGADPAAVYALLADGSTWPEWSPLGSFDLVEPGDGTPEGLGAVRLFTTGRHRSRERVVECRPGEAFAYVLEEGLPLRGYKAVVTLTPATAAAPPSTGARPSGPRCPGTGWLYRRELGRFIRSDHRGAGQRRRTGPRQAGPSSGPLPRRWPRPPRCSSRRPRGCTKARRSWERDSCSAGSASPRRPRSPSSRAPRPSMARRAWKSIGGTARGRWRPARRGRSSGWPPRPRPGCGPAGPAWPRLRPGPPPGPRSGASPPTRAVTSVSPPGRGAERRRHSPPLLGKCSPDGVHRLLMLVPYAP